MGVRFNVRSLFCWKGDTPPMTTKTKKKKNDSKQWQIALQGKWLSVLEGPICRLQ